MKQKIINIDESTFKPVTISITFESMDEVKGLLGRLFPHSLEINKMNNKGE